jgi:magnesium chelatase subunit I
MQLTAIKTFGELKKAKYHVKSIKQELKDNLVAILSAGKNPFPNIHGYQHTVIPELERAILSKHNINLLGLRGQAKTKIARLMIDLLDEFVPIIEGSEVMDNPFEPMSYYGKQQIETLGDKTPISWIYRSERFSEKLATPDVTVSDLIGDVDPIKAVNHKLTYADERVIHFGMIPRANRCIFVINELPDLQARIQVSLFNILQEGDVQIRGFKFRFPLDIQFVFTANPEDYTNRGSIITPLKDRIGAQILTHYPKTIELARKITEQEAKLDQKQLAKIYVPELARDIIEQITFEARSSEFIDAKSGVSARLSISALEALVSSAELRCLKGGYSETKVRLSDFGSLIPAMTGKMELVYEGEQEGSRWVAEQLIGRAISTLFIRMFPKIEKLEKPGVDGPYTKVVDWFMENDDFTLPDLIDDKTYDSTLSKIKPLINLMQKYTPNTSEKDSSFMKEFVLWALVEQKKLSKHQVEGETGFRDTLPSFNLRNN